MQCSPYVEIAGNRIRSFHALHTDMQWERITSSEAYDDPRGSCNAANVAFVAQEPSQNPQNQSY